MKKRTISVALSLFVILSLFTGCGGGAMSATDNAAMDTAAAPAQGWDGGEYSSEAAATGEAAASAVQPSAIRQNAKLILTADVYAETRDFPTADQAVQDLTAQYGGYLESRSVAGNEGSRSASYTVRVPQERFEAFLGAFGNTCNIVRQSQNAEDVGQAYFDAETHLKTLKTKHERLLALLDKSEKMEDIIQLETALSETEYEIEQYAGTLRRYDDLVGFSTISIQLGEVRDLTAVSQGNTFLSDMQKAAASGTRGVTVFIKTLILFMIIIWPLLAVAVIVLAVLLAIRRRRKARKAGDPAKGPQSPGGPPDGTPKT